MTHNTREILNIIEGKVLNDIKSFAESKEINICDYMKPSKFGIIGKGIKGDKRYCYIRSLIFGSIVRAHFIKRLTEYYNDHPIPKNKVLIVDKKPELIDDIDILFKIKIDNKKIGLMCDEEDWREKLESERLFLCSCFKEKYDYNHTDGLHSADINECEFIFDNMMTNLKYQEVSITYDSIRYCIDDFVEVIVSAFTLKHIFFCSSFSILQVIG